jgi:hypothetical protein
VTFPGLDSVLAQISGYQLADKFVSAGSGLFSFTQDLNFFLAAPNGLDDHDLPAVVENHVVTRLKLFEPRRRSWHEVFAACCVPKEHYGDVRHEGTSLKLSFYCQTGRAKDTPSASARYG